MEKVIKKCKGNEMKPGEKKVRNRGVNRGMEG